MIYIFFRIYYFILWLILKHRQTNLDIGRVPHGFYQEKYQLFDDDIKKYDPDYSKYYSYDIIYDSKDYRIVYTRFKKFRLIFKTCQRYPANSDYLMDIISYMFFRDTFR